MSIMIIKYEYYDNQIGCCRGYVLMDIVYDVMSFFKVLNAFSIISHLLLIDGRHLSHFMFVPVLENSMVCPISYALKTVS